MSHGTIRLQRNHDYGSQVQVQHCCSNLDLKGIIFVVYFDEDNPRFIGNITSSEEPFFQKC